MSDLWECFKLSDVIWVKVLSPLGHGNFQLLSFTVKFFFGDQHFCLFLKWIVDYMLSLQFSFDSIFQLKLCSFGHVLDDYRPDICTFVPDVVNSFLIYYFVDSAHLKRYEMTWTCVFYQNFGHQSSIIGFYLDSIHSCLNIDSILVVCN
jgi:hypothetical protein